MCTPGPTRRTNPARFSTHGTLTAPRNAHYPPHRHSTATTHLVLDGSLTVCYPEETPRQKDVVRKGEWLDVDKGRVHEVWIGENGCTYVIGE